MLSLHEFTKQELSTTGIYAIVSKRCGKFYIGSTSVSFDRRFKNHLKSLKGGYHDNSLLQTDWDKYGCSNFQFKILEIVSKQEITDTQYLFDVEQIWMDLTQSYNPERGYNISPYARSGISLQSERWIVTNPEGVEIEVCNLPLFCKTHKLDSSGMVAVARGRYISCKGWKCRYASEKSKDYQPKLRDERVMEGKFVLTSPEGIEVCPYSLREFCREHGLSHGPLWQIAKGQRISHKGWKCRYADESLALKYQDKQDTRLKGFIVTDPNGQEYDVPNLSLFCREHGIPNYLMLSIASGRQKTSKCGWTCRSKELISESDRFIA